LGTVSPGTKPANSESDSSRLSSLQVNNDWSLRPRRYMSSGSHIEARKQSFRFGRYVGCDCQVKKSVLDPKNISNIGARVFRTG